jgi:hypothetical protein
MATEEGTTIEGAIEIEGTMRGGIEEAIKTETTVGDKTAKLMKRILTLTKEDRSKK